MSEVTLQILQAVLSVFEMWLCNQFLFATIIEKDTLRKKEKIVLWVNVLLLGTLLTINRNLLFFSRGMLYFTVVLNSLCVIYIGGKRVFGTLLVTLYHFLLSLFDFFFAFISMDFLGQEFDQIVYIDTISFWKCVIYICSRVLMCCLVRWMQRAKEIKMRIWEYKTILILIDIALYVLIKQYHIKLVGMAFGSRDIEGGAAGITLLSITVIIFFVGIVLFKNKMIKKENELLIVRDEMLQKNYRELECQLEQSRQLMHDIKNHFLILKDYEKKNDYEGLHNYLQEMEKNYLDASTHIWTGNRIVDLVLEQQKEVSQKKGIQFFIEASPIPEWLLDDSELCSLFGNLLDNAVEACDLIKEGKKEIRIRLERQNQLIFVKIRNTIAQSPRMKSGRLISTKADKKVHGYGLKNVRRIVNKYEGEFSYQITEKEFQVNITFFDSKELYK